MKMPRNLKMLLDQPATLVLILGMASGILIAGAWWFETVMRLAPCKLCLEQRQPHYAAMIIGFGSLYAKRLPSAPMMVLTGLLALAGLMLWSTGLGAYHAGVEWGIFAGPNDCAGQPTTALPGVRDFVTQLGNTRVVSCTEAAWRFLGLSLAGWNAVFSALLAALAIAGVIRGRRKETQGKGLQGNRTQGSSSESQYR
jgi:disulfide bond formation protein DsbB